MTLTIIPVTHQKHVKGIHIAYIHETPESAAIQYEQRFGSKPTTVYQNGTRIYIPLTIEPAQFWTALRNEA